ncbi:GDNF family receptor alpha-like [Gadus macrocephalus]|uniref:GDNF family receptor alpha-like n=1 Tax=Gadus macrocephalus TaxID=80720 RepID=UPI0028CBBB7C|nr:GDNF family receptor alpha-like [Gadus macrocephalus]
MPPTHLGNALILGVVIHHVAMGLLSRSPDCLRSIDTCISDLCRNMEQAGAIGSLCGDDGCQIIGSEVCNVSVGAMLEQFPSLQQCMCVWLEEVEEVEEEEVEPCRSLQALTTQCHQKPALRKRSTPAEMDWKASNLLGVVSSDGGSCLKRIGTCLADPVCNRNLWPLLEACGEERCHGTRCRGASRRFYGGLPASVADLLVMCDCGPGEKDCRRMAARLHRGTCGGEVWSCQEGVSHCWRDQSCRQRLKSFTSKCWHAESATCGEYDDGNEECVWQMEPALLLSGEAECRTAFLALMGTPLQYPCTCTGLNSGERQRCDTVSNVLHNRSRFTGLWPTLVDSNKTFDTGESKSDGHTWVTGHFLYGLIYLALIVIVILVTTGILCKSGVLRKKGQTQFHPLGKPTCVAIL